MSTPARTRATEEPAPRAAGREHALATARTALADAAAGHPRVLLVLGEAGIGKTTVAESLAAEARLGGWTVVWSRDAAGGGEPLRPWRRVVADLRALRGAAPIFDAAPAFIDDDPLAPTNDERRVAVVADALRDAGRAGPTLVVLEDVDRIDAPSARVLEGIARELVDAAVAVLATARDAVRVRALLAEPHVRHVRLEPLTAAEVASLAASIAGPLEPSTAAALHERTGGNPFFVVEILRASGDPLTVVPPAIDAFVRRGLAALEPPARAAVDAATVAATPVSPSLAGAVLDVDAEIALGALDAARSAGLLTAVDGAYDVEHAVIRDAIYGAIAAPERARLHARFARALEARAETDPGFVAAVARHHAAAVDVGGPAPAATWAVRAGRAAAARLAFADAVPHFERALALRASTGAAPSRDDGDVLRALGDARARSGDLAGARAAFLRAIEIGRGLQAWPLVARAALGAGWWSADLSALDGDVERALTDAEARLDPEHEGLRAWVLARLARARYRSTSIAERDRMSTEALALARRSGDRASLVFVLSERHQALWAPDRLAERLAAAEEMARLADAGGDRGAARIAYGYRALDLLERGDATGLDHVLALRERGDADVGPVERVQTLRLATLRAALRGDLARSEALATDAREAGCRLGLVDAEAVYAIQLMYVSRLQGRVPDLAANLAGAFTTWPDHPAWRIGATFVNAVTGNQAAARDGLVQLAADDFAAVPFDGNWIAAMSVLADVAGFTGERDVAAALYRRLLPYAERHAVAGFGLAAIGAVAFYLARLAAVAEEWDLALGHLDAAAAQHAGLGAAALAVLGDQLRGFVLLARDRRGDRDLGTHVLARTRERARALGMRRVEDNITARIGAADPVVRTSSATRPRSIRREGDVWTLEADARVVRVRHCKGMTILAELLRHPGRDVHVHDLLQLDGEHTAGGDLGPAIDARARREYRRRLADLRAVEADAEASHDVLRAGRAREEIEQLRESLARAVGLGGRTRRIGGATERARLVVRKRLRVALARIRDGDAVLAHQLEGAIRTGTLCTYRPAPDRAEPWLG